MQSDIWEEDSCGEDDCDTVLEQKSWSKMHQALFQEGFREGVSQGQELSTQSGFNDGYRTASTTASKLAHYRGLLLGLKSYLELTGDGSTFASPEILQQVQDLIQKTTAVEKQFIISKGRDSGPRLFGSKSNIQQTTLAKPNDGAKLDESKAKPVIATETIATDARATCDDDNDDDGNTNKTQSQTSEASGTVTRECLDSYLEDISKRCRTILKELRISIPI